GGFSPKNPFANQLRIQARGGAGLQACGPSIHDETASAAAVNLALKHRRGKTPGRNNCHLPVAPQPCTVLRMNQHIIAALLLAAFTLAGAQTAQTTPPSPAAAARPADVDTIDHIIAPLYDVISVPPAHRHSA